MSRSRAATCGAICSGAPKCTIVTMRLRRARVESAAVCSRCAGMSRREGRAKPRRTAGAELDPADRRKSGAHQRYSLRHERFDPGGLCCDGDQPYSATHEKCRCAFMHWADVRGNSSGIFRAVCGRFIELAESGPPIPRHPYHKAATTIGGSNEIGLRTADTTTRL